MGLWIRMDEQWVFLISTASETTSKQIEDLFKNVNRKRALQSNTCRKTNMEDKYLDIINKQSPSLFMTKWLQINIVY